MSPAAGIGALLRLRAALLRNRIRGLGVAGWLKTLALLTLAAVFLLGEGLLAFVLLRSIQAQQDLAGAFVLAIVEKLLALVFLVSMSMLFFSNITASLATIYLSRDLDLLLATPVPAARVFLLKLLETVVNSSYVVVIFVTPILVACGLAFGAGAGFYLQIPLTLALFVLPPAGAGILLTMLLMRYLPARRLYQAMTVVGITLAVSFITLVRVLAPERLLRPTSTDDFREILRALTVPAADYLPSSWAANLSLSAARGDWSGALGHLGWLFAVAAAGILLVYALAHVLYLRGVSASHEGSTRRTRGRPVLGRPLKNTGKELRLFFRDPGQWSQLLLLLALVVVYVFNITALPQDLLVVGGFIALRDIIAWINVGLAGFVLAAVCLRFVLPSVSAEGGAFWLIASSPLDRRRYLWRKLLFFFPPMLVFALALVWLSGRALNVDAFTHGLSLLTVGLVTCTLVAMGVGLGAALPSFKLENPAQFVLTGGGVLYGVTSLIYVVGVVALEAKPFFWHLLAGLGRIDPEAVDPLPYYAAILAASLLLAGLSLAWGLHRIRRLEF